MILADTISDLQTGLSKSPADRRVLVPTMGALHEGHLRLCDVARQEAGADGDVVVSIFVNPTQFGPNEDLDAYPRTLEKDQEACRDRGVNLVFAPSTNEMYHGNASTEINETLLSRGLCGASRPGHFNGVCTVVTKLFHLIQPDAAVFGQKDYQQLAVLRRMVRDLNIPVEIIGAATIRESDGLAMSSRNLLLSEKQRQEAPIIYESLCEVRDAIASGKVSTPADTEAMLESRIAPSPSARIDYLKVVDPESLEPLSAFGPEGFRIMAAVFFGKTRLIDNIGPED